MEKVANESGDALMTPWSFTEGDRTRPAALGQSPTHAVEAFAADARRILTMAVTIRVPTTLRTLTAGESEVQVEPGTVQAVLASLEAAHPGFAERLMDEDGNLRRFVNVFVDDDDVRFMDGLATDVPDGETLSIVPAVAGG